MRQNRPVRLRGWMKWLPFLAGPFAILFAEAALQSYVLYFDYEILHIQQELARTRDRLAELRDAEVRLTTYARIEEKAAHLGMVKPRPNQIHEIHLPEWPEHPNGWLEPAPVAIELASLEAVQDTRRRQPERPGRPTSAPETTGTWPPNQPGL